MLGQWSMDLAVTLMTWLWYGIIVVATVTVGVMVSRLVPSKEY